MILKQIILSILHSNQNHEYFDLYILYNHFVKLISDFSDVGKSENLINSKSKSTYETRFFSSSNLCQYGCTFFKIFILFR